MRSRRTLLLVAPLVATGLLGVVVLQRHGAPAPRLALMLGSVAVGAVVASALAPLMRRFLQRFASVVTVGALALVAATLFGEGLSGVRRWIALGPVQLHASSIACPVLLMATATLLSSGRGGGAAVAFAAAQILHAAQPDAGQATALALAAGVGLALWPAPPRLRSLRMGAVAVSVVPAWLRPDPLAPVAEVEGIVGLAGELGLPVQALAVVLLALLPLSLAVDACCSVGGRRPADPAFARATGAALAAYVTGLVVAPIFGHFPVPVLGFGVSPVLGVAICVGFSVALGEPVEDAPATTRDRGMPSGDGPLATPKPQHQADERQR